MSEIIGVAKVTSKGQITIPIDVRKALGIEAGSRVVFSLPDEDEGIRAVVLRSSAGQKLKEVIDTIPGVPESERLSDEEVAEVVSDFRREHWREILNECHG